MHERVQESWVAAAQMGSQSGTASHVVVQPCAPHQGRHGLTAGITTAGFALGRISVASRTGCSMNPFFLLAQALGYLRNPFTMGSWVYYSMPLAGGALGLLLAWLVVLEKHDLQFGQTMSDIDVVFSPGQLPSPAASN